jgi:chromosome segregation protein
MHFKSLRLSGFKSFVETTELEIAPGLTGVVGPNGCGKSNLVEALRWVMGENSAKRMRGGEMDDVIFAGTTGRPARNLAEITLTIDNRDRAAPAVFNTDDELEVRRRIDRGEGSDYRVNGKQVRQRDVQLLFADAAIGANSPAMVSQGRVAALIAAKPVDRRYVLEDAAGITGLQSRRHEAELKLKAAENNLAQIDTVLEGLRGQEAALKRQARQAEKYRLLSTSIRETETLLLYSLWTEATTRLESATAEFETAESAVRAATSEATAAGAREAESETQLPSLRAAQEEANETLRQIVALRQDIEARQRQMEAARDEAARELAQSTADRAHEEQEQQEANANLARLAEESAALNEAGANEAEKLSAAETITDLAGSQTEVAESAVLAQTTALAKGEEAAASIARQEQDFAARRQAAGERHHTLAAELDSLLAARDGQDDLEALTMRLVERHDAISLAEQNANEKRSARDAAETDLNAARAAAETAQAAQARLMGEIAALEAGIAALQKKQDFPAILAHVTAEPGYEAALAAALGADLNAAEDEAAPYRWRVLSTGADEEFASLPEGVMPLANHVHAPASLSRALGAIGVAEAEEALRLQQTLPRGTALVTRAGALYRWDGLVREAGQAESEAEILTRRNRLEDLTATRGAIDSAAETAVGNLVTLRAAFNQAQEEERAALTALGDAMQAAHVAEAERAAAEAAQEESRRREARLRDMLESAAYALAEADQGLAALETEKAELLDLDAARAALSEARETLTARRAAYNETATHFSTLKWESEQRLQRLAAIGEETQLWQNRAATREGRIQTLSARIAAAEEKLKSLADRPAALAAEMNAALTRLEEAEQACREAADRVMTAETTAQERRREARHAQEALAAAREARARAEMGFEGAREALSEARARLTERVEGEPEALAETLGQEAYARADLDETLAKLNRERDAIGPVNLRAETELTDILGEIEKIDTEKADLVEAIARLRQAISKLNQEARERLATAFETVRGHFKRLFTTLFGGGEAELTLTGIDDPMTTGLEIYASPPGKKLQSLSLLSGGEQALTALSLLFAMFLATPAPVCVLDEVDAPLDDANVTRFCNLLDEIVASTGTRFLVITHHRVTMARMDRLYGVTMAERGVSMLVSVDLSLAEQMTESNRGGGTAMEHEPHAAAAE